MSKTRACKHFTLLVCALCFSLIHASHESATSNQAPDSAHCDIPSNKALPSTLYSRDLFYRPRQQYTSSAQKTKEALNSLIIPINFAKATDLANLIKDRKNSPLSSKGKVNVDKRTNTLWIEDNQTHINQILHWIHYLDVPVKQVIIEARIVEVSKDVSQDLGLKWESPMLSDSQELEAGSAPNQNATPLVKRLNVDLIASPVSGYAPAAIGIALARLSNHILLDLELSALESEGCAQLLASPRLITTNQQTAIIESGEEIPYQEVTSSGATSVSFKKAVLSLKVTPQITQDKKILMDLKITQDTPSVKKINGVPSIDTKEIQTSVLAAHGETIVLGGIYKEDRNQLKNSIPFLGKIPGIKILFQNQQHTATHSELLIFITPKLFHERRNIH